MTRHASTSTYVNPEGGGVAVLLNGRHGGLGWGTSPLPLFAAMLAKAEAAEPAVWENIDAMRRAIEGGEFGRR